MTSPQEKTLGTGSLMGFPGQEHCRWTAAFSSLRERAHCMWPLMGGRQQREACPWILPESACAFPLMIWFCILTMSPSYTLDVSRTIFWVLCPSSKSPNVGVVLGTLGLHTWKSFEWFRRILKWLILGSHPQTVDHLVGVLGGCAGRKTVNTDHSFKILTSISCTTGNVR